MALACVEGFNYAGRKNPTDRVGTPLATMTNTSEFWG